MSDFDFGTDNNEFFLDLSDAEDTSNDFKPLPPGTYTVIVDKIEQKKSQAGNNMLAITMSVVDSKRKLFDNILLDHSNPEVVKIGRGRAKSLFMAGFGKPTGNFIELQGKLVDCRVGLDKRDATKNQVQSYSACKDKVGGEDVAF